MSLEEIRRDILQLKGVHLGKSLVDLLEDHIVQIPGLVDIERMAGSLVFEEPLSGLFKISAKVLLERNLTECLRSSSHDLVHSEQTFQHSFRVVFVKVEAGRLLEHLMPHLMPHDGDTDQLLTDKRSLFDEIGIVLLQLIKDRLGSSLLALRGRGRSRFGGDSERVDQGLRMFFTDHKQKVSDELADDLGRGVDSGDQLRDDLQPGVDAH